MLVSLQKVNLFTVALSDTKNFALNIYADFMSTCHNSWPKDVLIVQELSGDVQSKMYGWKKMTITSQQEFW